MKLKTQSSRNARRPLIKAAKGMVAMTFLGGCRIWNDGPPGGGGAYGGGGSGGNGGGGNGGGGDVSWGGGGNGGNGGVGGGGDPTCEMSCGDALILPPLCETASQTSQNLFKAFMDCACIRLSTDAMPGCADPMRCGDNVCVGLNVTKECENCVTTTCQKELSECVGDVP